MSRRSRDGGGDRGGDLVPAPHPSPPARTAPSLRSPDHLADVVDRQQCTWCPMPDAELGRGRDPSDALQAAWRERGRHLGSPLVPGGLDSALDRERSSTDASRRRLVFSSRSHAPGTGNPHAPGTGNPRAPWFWEDVGGQDVGVAVGIDHRVHLADRPGRRATCILALGVADGVSGGHARGVTPGRWLGSPAVTVELGTCSTRRRIRRRRSARRSVPPPQPRRGTPRAAP